MLCYWQHVASGWASFFFSMNTECVLCLWGRLWHGWLCACEEGPGHHYF